MNSKQKTAVAVNVATFAVGLAANRLIVKQLKKSRKPGRFNRFVQWNLNMGLYSGPFMAVLSTVLDVVAYADVK